MEGWICLCWRGNETPRKKKKKKKKLKKISLSLQKKEAHSRILIS